ncbi:hypothetical protein CEXT_31891 [Caerostris extrusa]|uniref:Secreted protein n=1 Tax=Caerostris extrusa TaxID=172846 RepID=A0AAV4XQX2_CAEEX|nr:hypothetical protein CEXT_31891 [Caerostris extrusa]
MSAAFAIRFLAWVGELVIWGDVHSSHVCGRDVVKESFLILMNACDEVFVGTTDNRRFWCWCGFKILDCIALKVNGLAKVIRFETY